MGGFLLPEGITKNISVKELKDKSLIRYHDEMHVFWNRRECGYPLDWTFMEIMSLHYQVTEEMKERNIPHIVPINGLDNVRYFNQSKKRSFKDTVKLNTELKSILEQNVKIINKKN